MAFEDEVTLIVNMDIRKIVESVLQFVPDYFYKVPASSSGKYHPAYALGEGGLYRHVQAAVKIACHMMTPEQCNFTQDEKDVIIASLILHDAWKQGENGGDEKSVAGHTVFEHPLIASEKISSICAELLPEEFLVYIHPICENIESHMGQWNTMGKYSRILLPKPQTEMQKFVHMADYLASRKDIEIIF